MLRKLPSARLEAACLTQANRIACGLPFDHSPIPGERIPFDDPPSRSGPGGTIWRRPRGQVPELPFPRRKKRNPRSRGARRLSTIRTLTRRPHTLHCA